MARRVPLSNRPTPGSGHFLQAVLLRPDGVPSWRDYPFHLPAVQALRARPLELAPDVTLFVGQNGTGKFTLLEGIAVAFGFNPEGGSRNFRFRTRDTHSPLSECLTLKRGASRPADGFFLRAEASTTSRARWTGWRRRPPPGYIQRNWGGQSLHEQSHGEAFFSLFMHRFGGSGLYLMDEPAAALSPMRQMAMLARMYALAQDGAQFVVATHSPILMAFPGARLLRFDEFGYAPVTLEETEHYFVTREFLNAPERMLRNLLTPPGTGGLRPEPLAISRRAVGVGWVSGRHPTHAFSYRPDVPTNIYVTPSFRVVPGRGPVRDSTGGAARNVARIMRGQYPSRSPVRPPSRKVEGDA